MDAMGYRNALLLPPSTGDVMMPLADELWPAIKRSGPRDWVLHYRWLGVRKVAADSMHRYTYFGFFFVCFALDYDYYHNYNQDDLKIVFVIFEIDLIGTRKSSSNRHRKIWFWGTIGVSLVAWSHNVVWYFRAASNQGPQTQSCSPTGAKTCQKMGARRLVFVFRNILRPPEEHWREFSAQHACFDSWPMLTVIDETSDRPQRVPRKGGWCLVHIR